MEGVDSAMLNDGCLHKGGSTKGKAELFCLQYFLPLQTEEAVALELKNLVQQQCYLHFWLGK